MADIIEMLGVILAIIVGVMAAIAYAMRVLVIMERRVARIDHNIEKMTKQILVEEDKIESEVEKFEKLKKRSKKKR